MRLPDGLQQRSLIAGRALMTALVACVIAASSIAPAQAAKFFALDYETRNDPSQLFFTPRCNAKLTGVIRGPSKDRPGDAKAVAGALKEFKGEAKADRFYALCLSSQGGDLREALRIADLLSGWMTVVESGDICVSACAILFMKAARRDKILSRGSPHAPGRYLHFKARLGFHAPRLDIRPDEAGKVTVEDAQESYARSFRTFRALVFQRPVDEVDTIDKLNEGSQIRFTFARWLDGNFLRDVDIPFELVLTFLSVPPDEIFWIETLDEAMNWGIDVFGFAPPKSLTHNMLMIGCVNVTQLRCQQGGSSERCGEAEDGDAFTTRHTIFDVDAVPDWKQRILEDLSGFTADKVTVWPKGNQKSRIASQVFQVRPRTRSDRPQDKPCAIRAHWLDGKLRNLEIFTFNDDGSSIGRASEFSADHARAIETWPQAADQSDVQLYSLRPWQMLPLNTRLDRAGDDPWGWLDDGPDFFDKPANFEQK